MKLRSGLLVGVLGSALAAVLANDAGTVGVPRVEAMVVLAPGHAVWSEVKWPFPLDEWGTGRAFRCAPSACGTGIDVYLRAKVGFCNCATGVSDDTDLDRVSDLELFSEKFVGLADGHPISVGAMKGRSRLYHVAIPYAEARDMFAIGFNDQCDVAVATVAADRGPLDGAGHVALENSALERLVLDFLNTEPVVRWAKAELGQNGI